MRIGPMFYENPHDLKGLLMVDKYGGEVERGLASLRFEAIDDDGVVLPEILLNGFDGAE